MAAITDIDAIGPEGSELARYRVSGGGRVLMGWRRGAGVEVTDRPAEGRARAYVVERGFHDFEQLRAFIGDYVDQAERYDDCPMSQATLGLMIQDSDTEAVAALAEAL